jgi:methylase of polypeptide subunit release factors
MVGASKLMSDTQQVEWVEGSQTKAALWRSENGTQAPQRVMVVDDTLTADSAYRYACEGTAMLWRGDYQNARQLLQAMRRRIDKKPKSAKRRDIPFPEAFHLYRQSQLQRARILGMLLIPLDASYAIPLKRAPDVKQACIEAYASCHEDSIVSLRELLGVIGAHEWRKNGVEIPTLDAKIFPHYGVFSPIRGEYLELIADAPLPNTTLAFDIGTGTGVIAALLAKRGVAKVVATDSSDVTIACAQDNVRRLGLQTQVEILKADLFPSGKADLIVCNPPWLPASANSMLDHAIFDPDSRMLRGYLDGLKSHLNANGEAWLIISDLAEHLKLRSREQLLRMFEAASLYVVEKRDIKPHHTKAMDQDDPLYQARKMELTSLWVLRIK